jgi:glutamine synthetase
MHIGVDTLPVLPKDAGDRNRTSPFAFTGNKFEFRAVGSSFAISGPLTALNTIMADSLDYMATELEKATGGDSSKLNAAVQTLLAKVIKEHKAVMFEGDGYSDEWHQEAEKRGLPNLRTTVDALPELIKPETIKMFEKFGVLSERELQSRFEIFAHRYCLDVAIESKLAYSIAQTKILPAAQVYQANLAQLAANLKTLGVEPADLGPLEDITQKIAALRKAIATLKQEIDVEADGETLEHAKHYRDKVIPAMNEVRAIADGMEEIMPDDLWPLPTYQEMLFIK